MTDSGNNLILQELVLREDENSFNPDIFKQQDDFIKDKNKFKSLLASRRAGKSVTAAIYLITVCRLLPGVRAHYIGLTRKSAKNILWKELKNLNNSHSLGIEFNNTDLIATLRNGAEIFLLGGNDEAAVETIRGMKSALIIIDEAQSYRNHLKYMIDEVITPMLIDQNGTLCLMGTPNASCAGPFFDSTTGIDSSYSVHKWTLRDNPYIPHAIAWLEAYKKDKKWSDDNPIYLREWCGRWVRSLDSIVYKYTAEKNDIKEPPFGKYYYLIGVDIGWSDASAIVVGAYREHDPTFYIIETFKKTNMTVDDIMEKLQGYIVTYKPVKVVMDSAGGGKLIAETFRKRYSIPIKAAQKKEKRDFIEQMNSDFMSGRIKVTPNNSSLTDEWLLIQWNDDKTREDEKYICDLADAALYTWRESLHYAEQPAIDPPKYGTDSWHEQQIRIMEEQAELELERRQQEAEEQRQLAGDFEDNF